MFVGTRFPGWSDVVQIAPALLQLHLLGPLVVVLVEHLAADVHSVTDDVDGHVSRGSA